MIPDVPNREGVLGTWLTSGEWARMVAALRAFVLAVEGCDLIYPSVSPATVSTADVRASVEQARGALWALTGEAVGRRGGGAGDDRS